MKSMSNSHWVLALGLSILLWGCGKPARSVSRDAATPEELVERMVAAIRSDDHEAMAVITAAPGDDVIRAKAKLTRDIQAASQALEKQCEDTFGPRESTAPIYGSVLAQHVMDSEFSSTILKRKSEVAANLVKQELQSDGQYKLTVEQSETWDGNRRSGTDSFLAVKTAEGWKLAVPTGLIELSRNERDKQQRLLELFQTVVQEVQSGLFRHRDEVDFLMARELINYHPDALMQADFDPPIRDDAERLGLRPAADQGLEFPSIRVEITPDGDGGTVRLRVGEREQESSPDLLVQQIQKISREMTPPKRFPIVLGVRPGISPEFVIRMLHVMLDVRALDFQPGIGLHLDAPSEFQKLAPEFTGRLRLFTIAAPDLRDPLQRNSDEPLEQGETLTEDMENPDVFRSNDIDPTEILPELLDTPVSLPPPNSNSLTPDSLELPSEPIRGTGVGNGNGSRKPNPKK